jgi:hypothetical protein
MKMAVLVEQTLIVIMVAMMVTGKRFNRSLS